MNHEAQAHMDGAAKAEGKMGVHMNACVSVVVPLTTSFGPRPQPREMKVDTSKVSTNKG